MLIAIDTETYLIKPGAQAPKLVCLSYCYAGISNGPDVSGVLPADKGLQFFLAKLLEGYHLVGHNIPFDVCVLLEHAHLTLSPEGYLRAIQTVFAAYDNGQIHDTLTRERLLDLAKGQLGFTGQKAALPSQKGWVNKKKSGYYSLAGLVHRHLGQDIGDDKGEDAVRLRYSEMDGVPVGEWPADFYRYALHDAELAASVYHAQSQDVWAKAMDIEPSRTRAEFALRLMECHGVGTELAEVAKIQAHCENIAERVEAQLRPSGLIRNDGTTDTKALRELVEKAYAAKGEEAPRTAATDKYPEGQVKTDEETIQGLPELGFDSPLAVWKRGFQARSFLSKYIPALEKGIYHRIHARYNSMLETGRTSCTDYIQTPPRDPLSCFECGADAKYFSAGTEICPKCGAWIGDIRRCYVPASGKVLCSVDYSQLELCCLAQACYDLLGTSTIGDAINAGLDLHSMLAATIMGLPLEEYMVLRKAKDKEATMWRQTAKGGNFGFPGGMKPAKFVAYVRQQFGLSEVDLNMAKRIYDGWCKTWYDMPAFFREIKRFGFHSYGSLATVKHPRVGLYMGKRGYTAACNGMFQPLAAAGALAAGYELCREAYARPESPLFGSRPVMFLHDEWIFELPEDRAHEAAMRMAQVMRETMELWTPRVKISAEPALMRRWYKGAEAVYVDGRLVPWEPKK